MAKKLDIPEDNRMSPKDFVKLEEHVKNSAMWYATNMSLNKALIIDKLKAKGLRSDPIEVEYTDGTIEYHDIIQETLELLENSMLVDDEHFARRILEREIARGKGLNTVKTKFFQKKVDRELADRLISEFEENDQDDLTEAMEMALEKVKRSSKYRKELLKKENGEWSQLNTVISHGLMRAGFSFDDIKKYLDTER